MTESPKLVKDLFLQATDGSQCVSWTDSQLTYLGRECTEIPSLLIQLYASAATRIDLSYCSLRSLRGMERFSRLQEVVLDNNRLTDGTQFPAIDTVVTLSLNKNMFEQIDSVLQRIAVAYPNLRFLSLLGNPGYPDQITCSADDSQYRRYRSVYICSPLLQLAIHLLRDLTFLDSSKVTDCERKEATKRAQFIGFVIKPTEEQLSRHDSADEVPVAGIGDPVSGQQTQRSAAFGKLKFRYTGRHSEGNRFIKNFDL